MSIAIGLACCLALGSSIIGSPEPGRGASGGDATLRALAESYYRANWRFEPDSASEAGVHDYDDRLGSFAASDFAAEALWLQGTLAKLDAIQASSLSLDGQVDQQILSATVKRRLFYLRDYPAWRRRPGFYNDIVANAIFQLAARKFAPPSARLRAVIAREKQVAGLFAQAQHNLDIRNVPQIVARFAAQDVDGTVDFLQNDLPKAFGDVHDPALGAQFRASNSAAIRATRQYARFIRSNVIPNAHGNFALGLARYRYLAVLENAQDIPIATLLAAGERALLRDTASFTSAARQINATLPATTVYAQLGRSHPSAAQLIPTAQRQLGQLVGFIESRRIIDLPNAPQARVVPTPEFEASTTEASFDAPGPLERVATQAYYNVTVPKHLSAKEMDDYLGEFNPHTLMIVSAHEIYPGHFTNYLYNQRAPLSLIRKLEWNEAFGEGWAHYGEQMMVDEGLGGGDPRYRLAQAEEALLRDCRLIVGIKEHTQGMSVEQATSFLEHYGMQAHSVALAEAVRGTTDPLYGHYTWGKLMLLKLRSDYQKKMGKNYSLARFHDAVLSHGDPPIASLRKLLLGPGDRGPLL